MYITIICFVILFIGLGGYGTEKILRKKIDYYGKKVADKRFNDEIGALMNKRHKLYTVLDKFNDLDVLWFTCILIGSIGVIVCLVFIIVVHSNEYVTATYNLIEMERASLEDRIKLYKDGVTDAVNANLFEDICEYNKARMTTFFWNNNKWISWFVPDYIVEHTFTIPSYLYMGLN